MKVWLCDWDGAVQAGGNQGNQEGCNTETMRSFADG